VCVVSQRLDRLPAVRKIQSALPKVTKTPKNQTTEHTHFSQFKIKHMSTIRKVNNLESNKFITSADETIISHMLRTGKEAADMMNKKYFISNITEGAADVTISENWYCAASKRRGTEKITHKIKWY